MKFLLSLSFLLFAASSSINASFFFAEGRTAEGPLPVLDVTGAPLKFGVPYYMVMPKWVSLGGVSPAGATPDQPCPIRLNSDKTDRGTPVVFSSKVQNVTGNITEASHFLISFYNLTRPNDEFCGGSNSTTWGWAGTRYNLNLVVGEEEKRNAWLGLAKWEGADNYYLLRLSSASVFVAVDRSMNLVLSLRAQGTLLPYMFEEAKSTEDEADKPVVIQMPRKMSV